jgi:hypothetical protein
MVSHVVSCNIPNGEQDALSFVIARAILMGLAKVTKSDGAVYGRNNVRQTNIAWSFSQYVAATNAALRTHKSGAFQSEKDLFEIGLRKSSALGNISDRGRVSGLGMER